MSAQIGEEIRLLFISFYCGIVLIVSYDIIRIFRRIRYASIMRSIVEDVVFWSAAAIYLFQMFLKYNFGRPRYFCVLMTAGTMLLFECFIGKYIVSRLSEQIKKILIILSKYVKNFLNILSKCVNKFFNILSKPLKKISNGFKLLRKKLKFIKTKKHIRKRGINDNRKQSAEKKFRIGFNKKT